MSRDNLVWAKRDDPVFLERFFSKVAVRGNDDCWDWKAYRLPGKWAYGVFRMYDASVGYGVGLRAHRVAYVLAHGPIPGDEFCCHTCDNPPCCNPGHLWLGSPADNTADADAKGRLSKGERHTVAKLSQVEVGQILDLAASGLMSESAIGRAYGVSHSAITHIRMGNSWAGEKRPMDAGTRDARGYVHVQGADNHHAKLTDLAVMEIRELLKNPELSLGDIGPRFGVTGGAISAIARGKTWKHLGPIGGLPIRVVGGRRGRRKLKNTKKEG